MFSEGRAWITEDTTNCHVGYDLKIKPQVGPLGKALSFCKSELCIFIAEKAS